MALTQISTAGVKDDIVTSAKIADDAGIEALIADDSVDEARLKISNAGSNGQFLSKQSGNTGGLTWADAAVGVGGGTGVDFNDNVKVRLGTGNDLEIYHDGTHNQLIASSGYVKLEATTNDLYLRGNTVRIESGDGGETFIKGIDNNAVELYYDNSKKFETTSTGLNITGVVVDDGATHDGDTSFNGASYNSWWDKSDSAFKFDDNASAKFGTGGDLKIFHNGTRSKIENLTGDFRICGNDIKLKNYDDDETYITCAENGSVELYYDNTKKLNTHSNGITVAGNINMNDNYKLLLGSSGSDLEIYHDGTDSIIDNNTGALHLKTNTAISVLVNNSENAIVANANGAVDLYYDNAKKFETRSDGVLVSGNIQLNDSNRLDVGNNGDLRIYHDGSNSHITNATGHVELNSSWRWADNAQVRCGAASDLQIYHDGSHSRITNTTGWLYINNNSIKFRDSDEGDVHAVFNHDAAVELYYDGVKKLETNQNGGHLYGAKWRFPDSTEMRWGTGEDLRIYHDGNNSYLTHHNAGNFKIQSHNASVQIQTNGTESSANFEANGKVELFYDNSKKFETTSTGVTVHGDLFLDNDSTSGRDIHWDVSDNALKVKDNTNINFGDGNDLQIFHDGSHSRIKDTGTGNLALNSSKLTVYNAADNEAMLMATENAGVLLYYDSVKRFETTNTGVNVTGSFTVNGAALAAGLFSSYAVIRHQTAYNVGGGSSVANTWTERPLTHETFDPDGIVSLSSNQFTLAAGTYYIQYEAPGWHCNWHKTRLYNVTDSSVAHVGTQEMAPYQDYGPSQTRSKGRVRLTISGSKAFKLETITSLSIGTNGFGWSSGNSTMGDQVWCEVEIWKES